MKKGSRGCDCMAVGFTTTCAINAHHHCCEFKSLHDKVYSIQHYVIKFVRLAAGPWFSPGTTVSSINKTDCHDITEILLKVTLSIIKPTNQCTKGPDLIYNYLCNQCLSPLTL